MFKWLRKNERGSVMVIVALSMVVLLGFSGLAVDFGGMAMTKQELQNAADAAALAAGQDRANGYGTATATATANAFIQANGFTPGDGVTVSNVTFGSNTVTVTISTEYDVALASILSGRSTETVNVKAVVEVNNGFAHLPYAMFAGQKIEDGGTGVTGTGGGNGSMTIYGDIHSNSTISMKHATLIGTASATAVDSVEIQGSVKPESIHIDMPYVGGIVSWVKSTGAYFDGSLTYKKNDGGFEAFINDALEQLEEKGLSVGPSGLNIYVNGDLTIQGNGATEFEAKDYPINLVVKGEMNLNGSMLTSHPNTPIILISETKGVTVNGGGAGFYGIVFASGGDVNLNGNGVSYSGSIYGQNIKKAGGNMSVSYNGDVGNHLPKGKVRLIE